MGSKNPNVVLVCVDALRARNLGCYGYEKPTSVNIDRISADGVVFERCFSCANATDPSLTTILSGRYPVNHGVTSHGEYVSKEMISRVYRVNFLQDIFRRHGYLTMAIDWLGRWHRKGFDYYSGPLEKKRRDPLLRVFGGDWPYKLRFLARIMNTVRRPSAPYYDRAETVTSQAIRLARYCVKKGRRFFLFVHYWDTHTPYNAPRRYLDEFINAGYDVEVEDVNEVLSRVRNIEWRKYLMRAVGGMRRVREVLALYDAAVSYIDSEVGRLVEELERMEVLDDTILVITSDHGESLVEHGIYFDHHGLYDVSIHVPLIIRYPGEVPRGRRNSALVQHVDLAPTILDLAGIDHPGGGFDGKPLTPLIREGRVDFRDFVYAEESYTQRKTAIRTRRYKYIFSGSREEATCRYCGWVHGGVEELYDLSNDPDEVINIVNEKPDVKDGLSSLYKSFIKKLHKEKVKRLKTGIDLAKRRRSA